MRVYAPRRCAVCGRNYNLSRSAVIPLDGEWRDVPDYFVQITSGRDINDVTHAKLVDAAEVSLTDFSGRFSSTGTRIDFEQCAFSPQPRDGYLCLCYMDYQSEKVMAEVGPSPNYKGKNRGTQRKEITVRHRKPFCVYGRLYTQTRYYYGQYIASCSMDVNLSIYLPGESLDGVGTTFAIRRYDVVSRWIQSTGECVVSVNGVDRNDITSALALAMRDGRYNYYTRDELLPVIKRLFGWIHDNYDTLITENPAYSGRVQVKNCYFTEFPEYNPRDGYILSEDLIFGERIEPLLLGTGGSLHNYWINYLTQHALLSACESLPRLSDNSIQNLFEIVGVIKSLVVDRKIEFPSSMSDAWLQYRYQYCTGKADINDAIKFFRRRADLESLDRELVGYGYSSTTLHNTHISCRCSVKVKPKNLTWLKKLWRALDTYGLTPDFYVIWDSIPYSFMVDWFLPIGDFAGVWDANSMYFSGEFYDLYEVCYSISYTREVGPNKIHCYTRWAGEVPSSLNSMYWFDAPSASNKTVGKRVLDAASIFIGF